MPIPAFSRVLYFDKNGVRSCGIKKRLEDGREVVIVQKEGKSPYNTAVMSMDCFIETEMPQFKAPIKRHLGDSYLKLTK